MNLCLIITEEGTTWLNIYGLSLYTTAHTTEQYSLFLAENLDKLPMCTLKPDTVRVAGWLTRDSLRILTGFPPISSVDLPLGRRGSRVNLCKRLTMTPRLLLLFLVMYFMRAGRLLERCGGVPAPHRPRCTARLTGKGCTDRQTQR